LDPRRYYSAGPVSVFTMTTKRLFYLLPLLLPTPGWADSNPLREALQDYLEFAEYAEGAIFAEQVIDLGLESFFIVDTRLRSQFDKEHLSGAVHIEWREIVSRDDEIPRDRVVVLYCDTGLLSAKAQFALRLLGRENVKVLFGGINEWKVHQGLGVPAP
jgi:rhodanese-related sulfurtransferase